MLPRGGRGARRGLACVQGTSGYCSSTDFETENKCESIGYSPSL